MSKTGIQGLALGRSDLFKIDPGLIVVEPGWNARNFEDPDNKAHVRALAESIRAVGVKEPLTIYMRDGNPILTNGESRLRAVLLLRSEGVEIATVPVQTEAKYASEADRLASQIIRNSGRPFTVLEQCLVFVRLLDYGMTEQDIAKRAGMTVERIRQVVTLNQAPAATKKLVLQGRVSATVVQRVIAKSKTPEEIDAKVKAALAKAEGEGKTRVSPRHMKPVRASELLPEVTTADVRTAASLIQDGKTEDAIALLANRRSSRHDVILATLDLGMMLDEQGRANVIHHLNTLKGTAP